MLTKVWAPSIGGMPTYPRCPKFPSSRGTYRSQRSGGRRAIQPIASTRIAAERAPLGAQRFVGDRKHSGSGTVPTPARRWRSWLHHPSGWVPFRHRPLTAESILPLARHPIRRESVPHPCCARAPSRPVFASPAHGTTAPARSSDNRPLRVVSAVRGFPIPFPRARRTPWGGRDRLPVGRGVSTFQPRRTLLGANHPPFSGRTPAAVTGPAVAVRSGATGKSGPVGDSCGHRGRISYVRRADCPSTSRRPGVTVER